MSHFELRGAAADEFPDMVRETQRAFGETTPDGWVDLVRPLFEPDRALRAFVDGESAGAMWTISQHLRVPGATIAAGGLTGVGVSPVHRRRGILAGMTRRTLREIHERGTEAVAVLWASEPGIYGRFGFGLAAPVAWVDARRSQVRMSGLPAAGDSAGDDPAGGGLTLRFVDPPDPAALAAIHAAVVGAHPGGMPRTDRHWALRLTDHEWARDGGGTLQAVRADADQPEGYVLYRVSSSVSAVGHANVVGVLELVATTARARRALWSHIATMDLSDRFTAPVAPDDALFHLVDDPRALSFTVRDGLYLRIVDLPRALCGRDYATTARATIDVIDDDCPWNAGRWRLEVGPHGATCERGDRSPDLTLRAVDLGAVFLGGPTLLALTLAGRVTEHVPGAARALSRAFAGDEAPFCFEVF